MNAILTYYQFISEFIIKILDSSLIMASLHMKFNDRIEGWDHYEE